MFTNQNARNELSRPFNLNERQWKNKLQKEDVAFDNVVDDMVDLFVPTINGRTIRLSRI